MALAGLGAIGGAPRALAVALNVAGGLALIGGSLLSWWKTRALGVLLIAVGAMAPFVGGSLSSLGALNVRVLFQFVGIALMFAGFLWGRAVVEPTKPAVAVPET